METDHLIVVFQFLILAVKQIFPDFEFMWLVEEAKKNLPLELDFLNEGRNAEKVAHMFRCFDFLKVRCVYMCTYMHPCAYAHGAEAQAYAIDCTSGIE